MNINRKPLGLSSSDNYTKFNQALGRYFNSLYFTLPLLILPGYFILIHRNYNGNPASASRNLTLLHVLFSYIINSSLLAHRLIFYNNIRAYKTYIKKKTNEPSAYLRSRLPWLVSLMFRASHLRITSNACLNRDSKGYSRRNHTSL